MRLLAQQFATLLWKCWVLRKRHFVSTFFEIILPLLTSILVVWAYASVAPSSSQQPDDPGGDDKTSGDVPPTFFKAPVWNFDPSKSDHSDILYAPRSGFAEELCKRMAKHLEYGFVEPECIGFNTEEALVSTYMSRLANKTYYFSYVGMVVHNNNGSSDKSLNIDIRFPSNAVEGTEELFPLKLAPGPVIGRSRYSQFAYYQKAASEAYLDMVAKEKRVNSPKISVLGYRFPYPKYYKPKMNIMDVIPIVVVLGFIVTSPIIVKRLVDEKASRSRELFRMMGLSDWIFWSSTFINYFLVYLLQALALTFMYCTSFSDVNAMVNYSNPVLVFLLFLYYGISFIVASMLLSVPFNSPVVGVIVSIILWILSYFIPVFYTDPLMMSNIDVRSTNWLRLFACLLPNMGLNFGIRMISQKEAYNLGITFANMFDTTSAYGFLSFGIVLGMQLISIITMSVLIWYLEAAWPWQYGMAKPLYFPFLRSYWWPQVEAVDVDENKAYKNKPYFERQMSLSEVSVCVRNLHKEFGYGFTRKIAVSDVSLDINLGQITVLLGHNGAGKTTTMNMITGMFPPTSGTVTVDGYSVVTQTSMARRSISLCPQHNVLYDELTVGEHLKLYAGIKGVPCSEMDDEVRKTVVQVDLQAKLNSPSRALSGGMKRRLSLGIALIGHTKVVILDEPTSGMDPEARRNMWDLLLSIKRERTILLTTHYMEEADALGDRIAIMASGEVKCCGTPMFLKSIFGAGYQLRIAKAPNFNKVAVNEVITRYFPHASETSEVEGEVVYGLEGPSSDRVAVTRTMPDFFDEFERMKDKIGVASCGVSVTTIEDVFLGVSRMNESQGLDEPEGLHQVQDLHGSTSPLPVEGPPSADRLRGMSLILQKFKGLFLKRVHFAKRHIPTLIFQFVVPCAIFFLLLRMDSSMRKGSAEINRLELSLSKLYGETNAFFFYNPSVGSSNWQKYYEEVAKKESAKLLPVEYEKVDRDLYGQVIGRKILEKTEKVTLNNYVHTYLVGLDVGNLSGSNLNINAWFNMEATQAAPISLNMMYNTILKNITSNDPSYSIRVNNYPLPSQEEYQASSFLSYVFQLLWVVLVPMSLPFLAASFVLFPIHERFSRCKLLQLMSGVHPVLFWVTSFAFDMLMYLTCCVLVMVIFFIMDSNNIFTGHFDSILALIFTLITYGLATIPLAYVLSFIFDKPSSGFTVLVILSLIFGTILAAVDFGYGFSARIGVVSQKKYDRFAYIARIFPNMALTKAVSKIYGAGSIEWSCRGQSEASLNDTCSEMERFKKAGADAYKLNPLFNCCPKGSFGGVCSDADRCPIWEHILTWSNDGIYEECAMMVVDAILFFAILALLELNLSSICDNLMKGVRTASDAEFLLNPVQDMDVADERSRIRDILDKGSLGSEALIVSDIAKQFGKFIAVKGLSFGVHNQECFGLLGVNGAGKTTTFRMLVGDLYPTAGNAYCRTYDIRKTLRQFQSHVGYCPQFDALLSKLTGRETLYMFGRIRGIPEKLLAGRVNELIVMADLTQHSDKKTEDYSGGTKRKLALAVALIGSPTLLFLDEPSAGVDPEARRKIWKTLAYVREHYGCSIVLTSHSMDECEALCSRIVIMVNGEFKCIGSIQHLRSKFGQGYTISAKIKREKLSDEYLLRLKTEIGNQIESAVLRDVNETVVTYHVTDPSAKLGYLFKVMCELKEKMDLEDYAVSDTTLEQIFVAFARQQVGTVDTQ